MKTLNRGTVGQKDIYTKEDIATDLMGLATFTDDLMFGISDATMVWAFINTSGEVEFSILDKKEVLEALEVASEKDIDAEELYGVDPLDGGTLDADTNSKEDMLDVINSILDTANHTDTVRKIAIEELAELVITGDIDYANSGSILYLKNTEENRSLLESFERVNDIEAQSVVMLGEEVEALAIPDAFNGKMYRKISDSYDVSNEETIPSVVDANIEVNDTEGFSIGQRI